MKTIKLTSLVGGQKQPSGRVYPVEVLRKAVERAQQRVKDRTLLGRFDEIDVRDSKMGIRPWRSSTNNTHVVTGLRMRKGRVLCELQLLDPLKRELLLELLKKGELKTDLSAIGRVSKSNRVLSMDIRSIDLVWEKKP